MSEQVVKYEEEPSGEAAVQRPTALVPEKVVEKPTEKFMGQLDYLAMSESFGNIETTPEQQAILFAPVMDEEVEIRADGLVYLPWMGYVTRLKQAFGTSWGLLPQGKPIIRDGYVLWGFYLVIRGKMASYAIGECEQTSRMSYGECAEGAKSNALMRLCKGMGISLELWQPSFIRRWISTNAVQDVPDPRKEGKFLWRRRPAGKPAEVKDSPPPSREIPPPILLEPVLSDANKVADIIPPVADTVPSDVVKFEKLAEKAPVSAPPPPVDFIAQSPLGPKSAPPPPVDFIAQSPLGPKSAPPPPADDAPDEAPVEGSVRKAVYVKVSGVNVHKPGPRSKVRNPSYRVMGSVAGSPYYYTFDKTFAVIAKEAMKTGNVIMIEYDVTPFGLKISSLKSGPFEQELPIK
jgi:hypothetical protein